MSKKNKLVGYYFAEGKQLTKINIQKDKKTLRTKRTVVVFDEDIKLHHMFIDEYGSRVVANKRNSKRIESPNIENRIESIDNDQFTRFTVKADILNSWLDKL